MGSSENKKGLGAERNYFRDGFCGGDLGTLMSWTLEKKLEN